MSISTNLSDIKAQLPSGVTLIAVSKTRTNEEIMEVYNTGQRDLGENKVQELAAKAELLPKDIRWHQIGHLQTNKVKFIAPFVHLIHAVDSEKLLAEINKQAEKCDRKIPVLLQIFIAKEETKFGFSFEEAEQLLNPNLGTEYPNIQIQGLMGMATNTEDVEQIRNEFRSLKDFHGKLLTANWQLPILSMGMSSDWKIAVEEGSTMVRIGSSIFGDRDYSKKPHE